MFKKIKIAIAHAICLLSPKNYVDVINGIEDGNELDKELLRRTGFY